MNETDDPQPPPAADEGEANEADAAEQRAVLDEDDAAREWSGRLPDDADEADAAEQRREVRLDEDEYR